MTIQFWNMPEKVSCVCGPLVELKKPALIREIGIAVADEEFRPNASSLNDVRYVQFVVQRDYNFREPAFYLTAIGGENKTQMHGFDYGRPTPLTESVIFTHHEAVNDLGSIRSLNRFAAYLKILDQKSQALLDKFEGHLDDKAWHAEIKLPYYYWHIATDINGKIRGPINAEMSREITSRGKRASRVHLPKVTTGHMWQKRLKGLSGETWYRLRDAGAFKIMGQDEVGPFVATRGGALIRPRDIGSGSIPTI